MADTTTPVRDRLDLAQRLAGDPVAAQRVRDAWQPILDWQAERRAGRNLGGVAGSRPWDCADVPMGRAGQVLP